MALLTSLFAGVSGLRNHQSMMDVIGNNISNVNTIGFKGSRVTFSDTFNQFVKAGTNPTGTTGGTNSYQIGLGMKINSIDRNWNQGTFERTGITTDLALQGQGMFVLKSNGQTFFSRAGAFVFDADGKLVSPQNGAIVQGKVANAEGVIPPGNNLEDIVIDSNLKLPAIATTNIKWGGNLKSNSELTRTQAVTQRGNINSSALDTDPATPLPDTTTPTNVTVYNELGTAFTLETTYKLTAANTYTMNWDLKDSTNTSVTTGNIAGLVFEDNGSGNFTLDAASLAKFDGTANRVNIPASNIDFLLDAKTITQNSSTATLSISADNNRISNVVSGSVTVYDSLGTAHQVTMKYTKIANNLWTWTASVPGTSTSDGQPANATGTILFNPDGTIDPANISPNNPQFAFTPSGGSQVVELALDFGTGFSGVTQTSSSSVISALSQNGSPSASLSNMNIDQYGNIVGIFTNGSSKSLAQIMVSTFNNLNGLISVGDNMYSAYANSGLPRIGSLGEETGTTVQSGALEQSNVDLSEEFTKMIVSQRGFQANARVITTADTLLQEITNLIR
ncbi:MAG: flagellar hook protein FlgE [Ignavibacteriales bacterium]|nr:flagellar hook protein FlgE [Ignavibacteriales bacterium]